jgi:hypothetical protein
MENSFKIITSTRRKPVLLHHGYSYNQDKENDDIIRWRCRNRKCKEFLLIQKKIMIIEQKEHNLNKNEMQTKKAEIMFEFKKRALEANETPFEILKPYWFHMMLEQYQHYKNCQL